MMDDPMEPMVPCDHVIAKLWEYVDGTLDESRSEEIRKHLEMCARCFPEYDFRRAYVRFMSRCSKEEVPPELRRQIFEMVLSGERRVEPATKPAADTSLLGRVRRALGWD